VAEVDRVEMTGRVAEGWPPVKTPAVASEVTARVAGAAAVGEATGRGA